MCTNEGYGRPRERKNGWGKVWAISGRLMEITMFNLRSTAWAGVAGWNGEKKNSGRRKNTHKGIFDIFTEFPGDWGRLRRRDGDPFNMPFRSGHVSAADGANKTSVLQLQRFYITFPQIQLGAFIQTILEPTGGLANQVKTLATPPASFIPSLTLFMPHLTL